MHFRIVFFWFVTLIFGANTFAAPHQLTIFYGEESWSFSSDELLAIAPNTLETITPWDQDIQRFSGVYLADFLNHLDVSGEVFVAKALDGYKIEIPLSEALAARAFIAITRNGQPMPIRSKGPYWIVFPWSDGIDVKKTLLSSWSVWQLVELKMEQGN